MKMFKKVIALATSAVMIMSCTSFAATTVASSVAADGKVTLTVNCGAENANKMVRVQIFEPDSNGFEALAGSDGYNNEDSAALNAAISYVSQHRADGTGKITVEYTPKGKKGLYTIRTAASGAAETTTFEYKTGNEASDILAAIEAEPAATKADRIEAVFAKDADAVITEYEFLTVDTDVATKEIYTDFDALSDTHKDAVYAYMAANLPAGADAAAFRNTFKKATYTTLVDVLTGDQLLGVIDKNKTYSGMATKKAYVNVRNNTSLFGDAIKSNALQTIENANLSAMTIADINILIDTSIMNAAFSYCQAPGTMESLISIFGDEITAAGGNVAGFSACTNKTELAGKLLDFQPFASISAFALKLNEVVTNDGTISAGTPSSPGGIVVDTPSSPGSSGGSGGGGGFGSGASITRPVPSTNIFTDNNTQGSTPAATTFTDLKGYEWAEQAIKTLKEKNIVGGKSATEFAPNDTVLREEFAKMIMLAVLSANVQSATTTDFADVDPNAWYAPYIAAATKSGVINGYGSTFGLGDTIRREDMAVMCYRAIKAAGITLNAEREAHKFTDSISDYAKEAIASMYAAGLINGYSETEFNGNGTATRAEAAMILYNVVQKYGK